MRFVIPCGVLCHDICLRDVDDASPVGFGKSLPEIHKPLILGNVGQRRTKSPLEFLRLRKAPHVIGVEPKEPAQPLIQVAGERRVPSSGRADPFVRTIESL